MPPSRYPVPQGDAPVDTRICPECNGLGYVELSGGHDPYTGERCYRDTCPECGGGGEIEVAPVDEEDISAIPSAQESGGREAPCPKRFSPIPANTPERNPLDEAFRRAGGWAAVRYHPEEEDPPHSPLDIFSATGF